VETHKTLRQQTSCPICNGDRLSQLWKVNGFTITRCDACTLVFVQEMVTEEELAVHYTGGSDEVYVESNADCLNYYYRKLRDVIRARFPKPGKILDLGCSRGWFLDVMTGWECHGSEISTTDAAAAQERYGNRIVTGSFEEYPLRENYFDVITLQDVFDHFRDPIPALEKCYRMLRPGGLIVIKVHNISCLYARLTGPKFYAIIPPSHLFYYNRRSLALALSKSGFQMVDSKFIGHILKVQTVFWRLSRSNKESPFYRIYRALEGTALGNIGFHKNLHDIITVLAIKPA
jgi:SAM-dependent methyltransferase